MKTKSSSTKIKIPTLVRPEKNNVSDLPGWPDLANWSVKVDPSTGQAQVSGVSHFTLMETA